MDVNEVSFNALVSQSGIQFVVPIWQRLYSWYTEEWEDLWNDIMDLYKKAHEENVRGEHFLGPIVVKSLEWKVGAMQRLTLIDGQQRLATLLLLCALVRNLSKESEEYEDLVDEIEDHFLMNKYQKESKDRLKLCPTQADYIVFNQIVNGAAEEELAYESLLRWAYRYFAKKLEEDKDKYEIKKLFDVIRRLKIVMIKLDPDDNPNRIFETLNYRGKELGQSDLVRNFFMMAARDELRANQIYETDWLPMQQGLGKNTQERIKNLEKFLRHYVVMTEHSFVKEDKVYAKIQGRLRYANEEDVISELKTIKKHSEFYTRLLEPSQEANPNIRSGLERLKRLGIGVYYPLLLKAYRAFELDSTLTEEDFCKTLRIIESYLVRRFFLKRPTHSLNRLFATLCGIHEEDLVDSIWSKLAEKKSWTAQYWPRDKEFAESFQTFPIYVESRRRSRFVLEILEESYGHPEKLRMEELTIEHVMPETLNDDWKRYLGEDWEKLRDTDVLTRYLHSIGNLTLIAGPPNSALQNKLFPEKKKDWYEHTNVELTKEIWRRWDKWSLTEIEERANILAEKAIEIWPGPR